LSNKVVAYKPEMANIGKVSRRDISYDDSDSQDEDVKEKMGIHDETWMKEAELLLNTPSFDTKVRPYNQFRSYRDVFNDLVISSNVPTMYPIVSVAISFDSKAAITITKKSESEYWVKMYSLTTLQQLFQEKYGGEPHQYIKMKEVAQNATGDIYAMTYFDNGNFRLRTFTR